MWSANGLYLLRQVCHPKTCRTMTVQVTKTKHSQRIQHIQEEDATILVDNLLRYTQELMSRYRHHVVAYSGGVDSSLVVALLLQQQQQETAATDATTTVHAVLGISPAVSQEQVEQARQVALHLKVDLKEVATTEGTDDMYVANTGQACYACKTHLYASLQAVHATATTMCSSTTTTTNDQQLYNGTNADDLQDVTRVGLMAATNFNVQSPLRFISKAQVRKAARHLGLPNWNAAAAPCLRSRLALGVEATRYHLNMIEQAERYIRKSLSVDTTANVRVRMLTNQRAMIEVDPELLGEVRLGKQEESFFRKLGFSSVSARQFRTGSVAKREVENDFTMTVAVG